MSAGPLVASRLPEWANPDKEEVTGELVGVIDPVTWRNFIGLVAEGTPVISALEKVGLTRYALNGTIRTDQKALEAYSEAKIAAVRKAWDMETVEEILEDLMLCEHGGHLNRIIQDKGLDPSGFYRLIQRDDIIREMYDEARQIQAEVMADKIREIADDGTNDTYIDQKGNMRVDQDVMGRSRIRVDTYKWVMSKLHWKRFGDKIQQDVEMRVEVDHVQRLTEGRKRVAALAAERAKK